MTDENTNTIKQRVKTPAVPTERTRKDITRQTHRIKEDLFQTRVGKQDSELTDVAGIGQNTAKTLRQNGYTRPDQLARASPGALQEIEGIGSATADDLIDAAAVSIRANFEELTDLDGVGPSIRRQLNESGIRDPHELRGKTQDEIAAIDGIGPTRAAKIRAAVEFEAPSQATTSNITPRTTSDTEVLRETRAVNLAAFNNVLKTPDVDQDRGVAPTANNVFTRGSDRQKDN
ncbi:MAG: hypothetical protein J07HQX50_01653 [Haloquadratum sp. J07HQX50]|nr:MAG: hypothetical protein J07HQX50_01653 [Haloquadratum sp. J07HQX50]